MFWGSRSWLNISLSIFAISYYVFRTLVAICQTCDVYFVCRHKCSAKTNKREIKTRAEFRVRDGR